MILSSLIWSWNVFSTRRRREQLLAVTQADVRDAAEKYLTKHQEASIALLGEANDKILSSSEWIVKNFAE